VQQHQDKALYTISKIFIKNPLKPPPHTLTTCSIINDAERVTGMIDLKKLKYAQAYMVDLANGTDPVSKQPLPQDTCLNNVQISRCFAFVAEVLREVLERDGRVQLPEHNAFVWSDDMKSCFIIADPPVQITDFLKPLNEYFAKRYMKRIPVTAFTDWLAAQGYLVEIMTSGNYRPKRPTPDGTLLGITTEQRTSPHGDYIAILYSADAQRFIVEHLKDIVKRWEKRNNGRR